MTRWLSSTPPGLPPAGTPASAPAAGGRGSLRTCHVATSCATRDDLVNALAPFVEGNAVFIPGRIPLEPADVVKLNLSLRDGPVAFSGTFEARAIYREGTGVMGKAGVLFLVRRLDEPSQAVHQQLLRRKRELAAGPRPASLTRTLFGRPAELPTPGPRTPGPQAATPGPVAHTPAPVLVTPQTPRPGSLPAPTVNPFAEMTTNAIDFFVEATLTEDAAGSGGAGADATTETPPPDFLGLPVPGPRKAPAPTPEAAKAAAATGGASGPPAPAAAGVRASGLSATVAAPLPPPVSGTAATISSPLPRPVAAPPVGSAAAPPLAVAASAAPAPAPGAPPPMPASARSTMMGLAPPPAVAPPPAAVPPAASAVARPPAASPPAAAASPPAAAASPPPAAMSAASSAAVTIPAIGAVRATPGETPPPIALSASRSDEMEELPEEEIHTLLSPVERRWLAIRRFFARLLSRRDSSVALTAERRPSRPRWMWIGLASAGLGVIAFLLMSRTPAKPVPVALTTVATGPSVAQLPDPEERSIPKPAAVVPAVVKPAPAAEKPAPPAEKPAPPAEKPAPPAEKPAPAAPVAARPAPVEAVAPAGGNCTADIESTPKADVEIDGRPVGRTPLRGAAVPCGESVLTLSHPRYRRVTQALKATPRAPAEVSTRLQRPGAELQLSPASASWKVNGRPVPAGAQSYDVLRFETVKVEARLPGGKTWRKKLYVKAPVTRLSAR
jgi:hypothetical protein